MQERRLRASARRSLRYLFIFPLAALIPSASAMDYHVGPGQPYATINSVPFENLLPGDTVQIHWQPAAYHEKILLSQSGTAAQPIRLLGVPGPNGQKPVIDGQDATSRPVGLPFSPMEANGVVLVTRRAGQPYGAKVRYVEVNGLDVQNGHVPYTFAAANGTVVPYLTDSSGIAIYFAENITIKNCDLHLNGDGLFAKSSGDEATQLRNILIDGNHLFDNGVAGSFLEHNSYVEGINVVYQNNHYGPLIPFAGGGSLKDRSAGAVVRYNLIDGGLRFLDLVEAQDGCPVICQDPGYHQAFVYGNVLVDGAGDPERLVHYGGDSGKTATYRKGVLYFAHNTIVIQTDASQKFWRRILFELSTNDETVDARNNIFYVGPVAAGTSIEYSLMTQAGTLNLGPNWTSPNWLPFRLGYQVLGSILGAQNLMAGATNDPGFVNVAAGDYHLKPGSACINSGGALPAAWNTIADVAPFVLQQPIAAGIDLGALQSGLPGGPGGGGGGTPPPPPPPGAPTMTGFSVSDTTLTSWQWPRATITMSSMIPTGSTPVPVTVTSSNPAVIQVPSPVLIWEGTKVNSFTVRTQAVTVPTPVTLTVSCGGATLSVDVLVSPL